jgi:hypothetical protein
MTSCGLTISHAYGPSRSTDTQMAPKLCVYVGCTCMCIGPQSTGVYDTPITRDAVVARRARAFTRYEQSLFVLTSGCSCCVYFVFFFLISFSRPTIPSLQESSLPANRSRVFISSRLKRSMLGRRVPVRGVAPQEPKHNRRFFLNPETKKNKKRAVSGARCTRMARIGSRGPRPLTGVSVPSSLSTVRVELLETAFGACV